MSRPDPFQELMDNLRRVLMPATSSTTSTTSASTITTSSPSMIVSPMAKPMPFSGVAEECKGFLLQCSLYMEMQPHLYSMERLKVSFIISLLSGKALQWAETIWAQSSNITQSFDNFVSHLITLSLISGKFSDVRMVIHPPATSCTIYGRGPYPSRNLR